MVGDNLLHCTRLLIQVASKFMSCSEIRRGMIRDEVQRGRGRSNWKGFIVREDHRELLKWIAVDFSKEVMQLDVWVRKYTPRH